MSSDGEDPALGKEPFESRYEVNKRSRISYSREFLLSMSELDTCKKLPSGFDESILSEFEDSSHDQQRVSGTFLSHGFHRGDYGSSPPTRVDSGNYSRGMHGHWDSRSSGKSDKDSDSQSDRDSDSGRRYASQSRRGWQAPEHDGLLGSGNFARPSSYTPVGSTYSLNKTTEPYHPPRPYKAVPHPRSSMNDSFNDETFGSSELTTEDRAEEERKRRASFELLRKEQQRAFQERQKPKEDFDITTLMDPSDATHSNKQSESEMQKVLQSASTDSQKSSVPMQFPGARPLVPPGFAGTVLEKKSLSVEAKDLVPDHSNLSAAKDLLLSGGVFNSKEKQVDDQMSVIGTDIISENSVAEGSQDNLPAALVMLNQLGKKQSEGSAIAKPMGLDLDILADDKVVGQSGHSNTILEKLFGNALTLDENPTSLNFKPQNVMDDAQSSHAVHFSKFVHLFPEGGKGSTETLFSGRSNNLLSLVLGEEKGESAAMSEQSFPNSLFTVSHPVNEQIKPDASSKTIESPEGLSSNGKVAVLPVLTCEDLENSILSEFSEGGPKIQHSFVVGGISDDVTKPRKTDIDDHASQHLLSLLQRAGHEDKPLSSILGSKLSDQSQNCHADNFNGFENNPEATVLKNLPDGGGQTSTLEALFGSAFMKALQSDGAPVSSQGAGSGRLDPVDTHEFILPSADDKLMRPLGRDALSSRNMVENDNSSLSRKCQSSLNMEEHFVVNDIQIEADKSKFQSQLAPRGSTVAQPEKVQLLEDDSLVAIGDSFNHHGNSARISTKAEFPSYSSPFDIGGPHTALDSLFKDRNYVMEQTVPSFQVPFERRESDISFPNVQNPPSSHLQPIRFNHVGPVYNSQDSYSILNNPLMKQRDSMLHLGTPPNHQIPRSMLRPMYHPSVGFDSPMLHPMRQQMHPPGSFPLSHQLQGTSGGPRSTHPNQQVSGLMQELNSVPGFPFGHRQPSFGGMPPPAPEVGIANNHPEALQRLFEREVRSNNKPMNPFPAAAAGGHGQGLYGHDLDLSFRYR